MAKIIKQAGKPAHSQRNHKMHGSTSEWSLMSGRGGLIKWNASRVKVTGEKPRGRNKGR